MRARSKSSRPHRFPFAALALGLSLGASCAKRGEGSTANARPDKPSPSAVTTAVASEPMLDPMLEFATLADTPAEGRGEALGEFYRRWGASDGAAAVLHAESEGGEIASASLREAFRGWLSADPEGAKAWIAEIETSRRALKFASALGECLEDPRARTEWAEGQLHDRARRLLLSRSLNEWVRTGQPKQAIEWLGERGEMEGRSLDVAQVIRTWTDLDPQAASEFLTSMEPGADRDAAVSAMVTVIAPGQSAAAVRWAETVENEAKRAELLALVEKIGGAGGASPQSPLSP